ncbi:hypothetical protein RW64_16525 [Geobacter sulfurreducens]|nr:hypothetical protein RW64_16525 [Geobacter sulfurreducens]
MNRQFLFAGLIVVVTGSALPALAAPSCREKYDELPLEVRIHFPAVILNAQDRGRDVKWFGNAALVADKYDECTVSLSYHIKGEAEPALCTDMIELCPARVSPLFAQSTPETVSEIDAALNNMDYREQKARIVSEIEERQRQLGITKNWEDEEESNEFIEVIIDFKDDGDKASVMEDVTHVGGELTRDQDTFSPRSVVVKIRSSDKRELLRKLKANPRVEGISRNDGFTLNSISITPTSSTDPYYPYQKWAQKIGMPSAWGITIGGNGVTTAVLDTGLNKWSDSTSCIRSGYNFISSSYNTNDVDPNGHGTKVASVIASVWCPLLTTDPRASMVGV